MVEKEAVGVTWQERDRVEERNRNLLDRELREKQLVFESRPYEAHVQFSNYCNMSCIMCWNGKNPPLKKMSPEVFARLRDEIAPDLTVITPHDGSEPTVVSWDETVALAREHKVRFWLTTNVQLFDEEKFHEVKDYLDLLVLSVDSHVPEVFEKIRPGAKAAKVYRNLETAARLCEEHQIQCMTQTVFMTHNAPLMPDTIAWMADRGIRLMNIVQMIDVNRDSWHLDATMHFSAEYLDWIKKQCVAVAEERKMTLGWYLGGHDWFCFEDDDQRVRPTEIRHANHLSDERRKLLHPGFCNYAYNRIRIKADGPISPCGLDSDLELQLGDLAHQSFEEIWNGPSARDLRRAHYTWDYPSLCKSCRYVDLPPVQDTLPFIDEYLERCGCSAADIETVLAVESPEHMLRAEAAPRFVVRDPRARCAQHRLVLSPGGQAEDVQAFELESVTRPDGAIELAMPDSAWDSLETNIGYWWAVLRMEADDVGARTSEARCLIRHEPLERIEGSSLKYLDQGHFPLVYLGGNRQLGWQQVGELPHRPPLRTYPDSPGPGRRFASKRNTPAASRSVKMDRRAYDEMVGHVHDVVENVLPEGAVAVVATKGDDSLLEVDGRELRHFPADPAGNYVGHHPPDDAWVIERVGAAHADGAGFLVIPASMRWWLDHYRGLAEHLGEPIVDERERCTIFALQSLPEKPGDEEDGETLAEVADRTLGYSGHHRMAFRRFYESDDDNPFPRFAVDAYGYHLVDHEGRRFVDWVNGGGPVILGYRHPAVTEAITAQLPVGPTLTLTHPVEVEVASVLADMVPCAERVAFGKNGSDALAAAVRLARAVTGRELILQYGGHGFHDWYVALFGVPGVPKALGGLVRNFPYNDLDALEGLFAEHGTDVAAVVMEPLNVERPRPGYLEGVRELTRRHEALLVFDEVITAFRLGPGGAQERFGVVPDLACLGKAMANGMPLSAVVGKREFMERLPEIAYGMTFRGETLSLAAARAVLGLLRDGGVAEHLEYIGGLVRAAFERACAGNGVRASLLGPEARMTFAFGDHAGVPHERLEAAFVLGCARRGVLTNANILPSLAHDEEAVRLTDEAFAYSLGGVTQLIDAGAEAVGQAIRAGFTRRGLPSAGAGAEHGLPDGFIDMARDERTRLLVSGWLLADTGEPCTIEVRGPRGAVLVAERVARPDVASERGVERALDAGFSASLPLEDFAVGEDWEFELRAVRGGDTLFTCDVRRPMAHRAGDLRASRFGDDEVLHL